MSLPENMNEFSALVDIIAMLRGPDGCPWDRKQTHRSLRATFLQECYEVLVALDSGDAAALREELGDLLLHIVLQAQIAAEAGEFDIGAVVEGISRKLVYRHPHVFGDGDARDAGEVARNWESLKRAEKGTAYSILDSVPGEMPALSYSQEVQHRVAQVGFDWEDDEGVIDKLAEEIREFREAEGLERRTQEFGDLLFTLANIARRQDMDLETALREANRKFYRRFARMEEVCRQRGVSFGDLSFDEQNALWEQVKKVVGE
ncbi:MAG: nucleoside triphosphate pyrophosphohydrolase [Dehalococcoidales bacterium]|nr:nucleoside triphosphate pyrophosphohydrolase [Dehalococcoidales bacterium]